MRTSIFPIFIIFSLLLAGYISGGFVNEKVKRLLLRQLSNIVLLLLFCMGMEFSSFFFNQDVGPTIVADALLLAGLITVITCLLLLRKNKTPVGFHFSGEIAKSVRACCKVILAFVAGLVLFQLARFELSKTGFSSNYLLYLLLFLVGMDLVDFKIRQLGWRLLIIPLAVVTATLLAALLFTALTSCRWQTALAAASGYGWFSLSGPMLKQLYSSQLGAMAFMTDFFREMLSILFLCFFGKNQPAAAIGLTGAAAMDSALPFIKENCDNSHIKQAIVSGFILTLLAPLIITMWLACLT